jgi:hypothetical protein
LAALTHSTFSQIEVVAMIWKLRAYLALLAGLALFLAVACEGVTQAQLEGILQSADSVSGVVTVKLKDGSTLTLNFQDVKVETLRKTIGSASLEPGSQVTIEVDDQKKPKGLKAHVAKTEGVINSVYVGPAKKTVTIDVDGGGQFTTEVTETTEIELEDHGDIATFSALSPGQEVEIKYDVGSNRALKIEVEEADEDEKYKVKGIITAVDGKAKTVTILARNGIEATYNVRAWTDLKMDGARTFDAIKKDTRVEAKFNPATRDLFKLEVKH